jgi:choline-sulfatase
MLRQGRYKLCYYHGHPPQLFDLADDPLEETDLAASPRHAALLQSLTQELLRDWHPDRIERQIETAIPDQAMLAAWAQQTNPASQYLWPLKPEHCVLEASP